jgi:CO/xanthine dehydrogenase FAD-binding subunit
MTQFVAATSVDEALEAVAAGARVLAGGSDLVVGARQGKHALPAHIVGIESIEELRGIDQRDGGLWIGALTTHDEIEHDPEIRRRFAALADGSALIGSPATRNVGTIAGNVMNASPAMDTGAPLVVLGATATLLSTGGARSVPVDELWTGPGQTTALAHELCTALFVPDPAPSSGSAYVRLEYRRAMEIAVVGAAASVTLDEHGNVTTAAVALTAVAPTILRIALPSGVIGAPAADDTCVASVGAAAASQAKPISDLRASDTYRRHTVGVMARRAWLAAVARAKGETIGIPVNRSLGIGAAL